MGVFFIITVYEPTILKLGGKKAKVENWPFYKSVNQL